ncbi:MAG TPA: hypothetical protein VFM35_01400 [Candidatus Binatia bacterium]|nr:hypothetical protein [Candidatus Binatia bacterium]
MSLNFLFMDDSYTPVTRVSSLTGVVVPVERYPVLRSGFYDRLIRFIKPAEGLIGEAPELHGTDLLRGEDDQTKLTILTKIATLITEHQLRIYRIGYFINAVTGKLFPNDSRLQGICWHSLLSMMEPLLREEMIIPVMDGLAPQTTRLFSPVIKRLDEWRAAGLDHSVSLRYSHNVLGEVFYADSRYSALTQVADIVAYLRNASDVVALGLDASDFKEKLAVISTSLNSCVVWEELISLIVDGQIQGPKNRAHQPYRDYGPITAAFRITPSDSADITLHPHPVSDAEG